MHPELEASLKVADTQIQVATELIKQKNYEDACKILLEQINIFDQINQHSDDIKPKRLQCYQKIALCYMRRKMYDDELKYHLAIIDLIKANPEPNNKTLVTHIARLGKIYLLKNDLEQANHNLEEALTLLTNIINSSKKSNHALNYLIYQVNFSLAVISYKKNEYKKSMKHATIAINYYFQYCEKEDDAKNKLNVLRVYVDHNMLMGKLDFDQGKFINAKNYFSMSLDRLAKIDVANRNDVDRLHFADAYYYLASFESVSTQKIKYYFAALETCLGFSDLNKIPYDIIHAIFKDIYQIYQNIELFKFFAWIFTDKDALDFNVDLTMELLNSTLKHNISTSQNITQPTIAICIELLLKLYETKDFPNQVVVNCMLSNPTIAQQLEAKLQQLKQSRPDGLSLNNNEQSLNDDGQSLNDDGQSLNYNGLCLNDLVEACELEAAEFATKTPETNIDAPANDAQRFKHSRAEGVAQEWKYRNKKAKKSGPTNEDNPIPELIQGLDNKP